MQRRRPIALLLCLTVLLLAGSEARADNLLPMRTGLASGIVDDDGNPSTNVSGIACKPGTGRRVCVVIDDQGRSAQVAFLKDGKLVGGPPIRLIGKKAPVLGREPTPGASGRFCKTDEDEFADLDGEGVAYAAPYFYVIGSHGCSRKKAKYSRSAFVTVRFRLDDNGRRLDAQGAPLADDARWTDGIEATYRLADALKTAPDVRDSFGRPLQPKHKPEDGMNVEGVAVVDGVLLAGLRAPSLDGRAFLVGANVDALFAPGAVPLAAPPIVIPLALGTGAGIRDLSVLPGGRLVGLSGPTRKDPATPFGVFVVNAPLGGQAVVHRIVPPLADVMGPDEDADGTPDRAKAEAILPLGIADGALTAIILFDGLPNGGAAEYRLPLPR